MSWMSYHTMSSKQASAAESAARKGEAANAVSLYRQAAEQEELALANLDKTKLRTLGITVVSAVALWYKAGDYAQARMLATHWLQEPSLPAFAQIQLQELLAEIDKFESLSHELDELRMTAHFSPSARAHLTKTVAEWKSAA